MPANEAALLAGEGDRLQPTFERLQRGHPVEEDPECAAAHRARPLLVSSALTHDPSLCARCAELVLQEHKLVPLDYTVSGELVLQEHKVVRRG
jgi:hypothetical protein